MDKKELQRALLITLDQLEFGISRVIREHPHDPYRAQYPNGQYILLTALTAKAQVLAALASLEAS